jgi:hypothetical protein
MSNESFAVQSGEASPLRPPDETLETLGDQRLRRIAQLS